MFSQYDDTFDGCVFRNNAFGIYSRAGISYLRNSRFENSSVCDYNVGVFWMFNSGAPTSSTHYYYKAQLSIIPLMSVTGDNDTFACTGVGVCSATRDIGRFANVRV